MLKQGERIKVGFPEKGYDGTFKDTWCATIHMVYMDLNKNIKIIFILDNGYARMCSSYLYNMEWCYANADDLKESIDYISGILK
jgi:hypothetical protein